MEAGLVAGYVIAWAMRKAKRVGTRLDEDVDTVLDVGLDKLDQIVAAKLGADPALADLQAEATTDGQVSELTCQRLELSLQAAVVKDRAFAEALAVLVDQLQAAERSAGVVAAGLGSTAVAGNVDIHAEDSSVAAWQMRDVHLGAAPPP